jgi:hypothetical protein
MKSADAEVIVPPMPRSFAIFAARIASMITSASWGIPDLKLVLHVQRHVAKSATLQSHIRPLAVIEPRHMGRRPTMHRSLLHLVRHL